MDFYYLLISSNLYLILFYNYTLMNKTTKLETIPVCGKEYNLTYKNNSCKCIHKSVGKTRPNKVTLKKLDKSTKKIVSLKSNPCKKGKMKNENGRCVLIKNLNKATKKVENPINKKKITLKSKKSIQDKPKSPNPFLKRIAAKTKNLNLDMSKSRNSIIIKNRNTPEQNVIKNQITKMVSKGDTDIIPQLTRMKSYSPLVIRNL